MKQIFDWMREQINELKPDRECYFDDEEDKYLGDVKHHESILSVVNEAEQKWEEDCCEWTKEEFLEFTLSDCLTSCGNVEHYSAGIDKYCRHCGKKIKVVE